MCIEGRACPECKKIHNTVVENTETGAVIEYLDKCKDCLMSGCTFTPLEEPIVLDENMNVEQLEQELGKMLLGLLKNMRWEVDLRNSEPVDIEKNEN